MLGGLVLGGALIGLIGRPFLVIAAAFIAGVIDALF